jgi:hypothetical protein
MRDISLYVYLFASFIAMRPVYRLADREMWRGERDHSLDEHFASFLVTMMVAWFWPLVIPYAWMKMEIPSREVRRARKRAKTAQALQQAERELADATAALNRAQDPYGRYIRKAG